MAAVPFRRGIAEGLSPTPDPYARPRKRPAPPRPAFEGDESGRCGGCGSRRIVTTTALKDEVPHGVCLDCRRLQEVETRDWPLATMCDNCAFRAGSPERADPYRWAEVEALVPSDVPFHCHKGLALTVTDHSATFAPPDPTENRLTICAGWLAANIAHYRRAARSHGSAP